jgi:hypothetical protein
VQEINAISVAPDKASEPERFGALRAMVLTLYIVAGLALAILSPSIAFEAPIAVTVPSELARLVGACLLSYAVFVFVAWFPIPALSRRIEEKFEDLIDEGAVGAYLVAAVACFALAELELARASWIEWRSVDEALRATLVSYLTGFSVDSFMNLLWASLWPVRLFKDHGFWPTAAFAAALYGSCALGTRVFGETRFQPSREADSE